MRQSLPALVALACGALAPASAHGEEDYYRLLSRDAVGAAAFTAEHPEWDGRGVVIAVLDTGVDPTVPGLTKTSAGGPKVVEARDFTGEGDVELKKARVETTEGVTVLRTDAGVVRGHDALAKGPGAKGTWWLGFFEEKRLARSSVKDVNRDGDSEDRFAVVAWRPGPGQEPLAVVDTDGDGDVSDETARPSFRIDREAWSFTHPDPKKDLAPIAFTQTVDVVPDRETQRVELHFDDGGHGTHVAGIAAGFEIQGKPGFHGIAPGAEVISLKLGDNTLAGGATRPESMKRAMEYAAKWAEDHQVPVVMNISYGIGSAIEGDAAIDHFLDDLLERTPLLSCATSAGNAGPGLSTVGTPSASKRAWTAAALLTKGTAELVYGARLSQHIIFSFSSRGGELAKPDGATPGIAWSTVPSFDRRPVKAGTSMASPQAAGVHALLLSAAVATKTPWTSALVKMALKKTAAPVAGYDALSQGAGLIRVGPAWDALKRLSRERDAVLFDWNVEAPVAGRPGTTGTASYWRVGGYAPSDPKYTTIEIAPVLSRQVTDQARKAHFSRLELDAEGFVDLDKTTLVFRGDAGASVKASFDAKAIAKPGLHTAQIRARVRGESADAFSIPVAVVTPWRFDGATRQRSFRGSLDPGQLERIYVSVPPGASAMYLHLTTPAGRWGETRLEVFEPDGREHDSVYAISERAQSGELLVSGEALEPGTWELVLYHSVRHKRPTHWALDVGFSGVDLPSKAALTVPDDGKASGAITLTNRFRAPLFADLRAEVSGIARTREVKIKGASKTVAFSVGEGYRGLELVLKTSAADYHKFTDIAVTLTRGGQQVARTGFGDVETHLNATVDPGDYQLEIVGGATHAPDKLEWAVEITEHRPLSAPIPLDLKGPDDGRIPPLYPDVPMKVQMTASAPLPQAPDGFHHRAELTITDTAKGSRALRTPIALTR